MAVMQAGNTEEEGREAVVPRDRSGAQCTSHKHQGRLWADLPLPGGITRDISGQFWEHPGMLIATHGPPATVPSEEEEEEAEEEEKEEMGAHGSNLEAIMEEDMHHWYNKFMRESPSGLITLFELKNMLQMSGMTEEAGSYVDQVFLTFDMDGDGYIDFVEYIAAISLLLKGEINQKLKWYFKLFDQDGNGKIDKDEMETIFKAIQDITRSYEIPPEDIVVLVYEKIDVNGEGELTLEEFISGAREHPDIMDMLSKMMDLTHVLEIIVRGQKTKGVN
ncbi:hypothetical protein CRUP_033513 [Coryphaenoides rupestris]|nr:hypothetical protein CRUP_033513 [Coryphaenoides rupestris]